MTKQQFLRAKGEIALAYEDSTFTGAFINASAAMLRVAWRAQQARLTERSKITEREIREFCSAL